MRHAGKYQTAGLCCLYHLREKGPRRLHMFEDLEGTDSVIGPAMLDEMLAKRFSAKVRRLALTGHVGIEPGVIGMRHP